LGKGYRRVRGWSRRSAPQGDAISGVRPGHESSRFANWIGNRIGRHQGKVWPNYWRQFHNRFGNRQRGCYRLGDRRSNLYRKRALVAERLDSSDNWRHYRLHHLADWFDHSPNRFDRRSHAPDGGFGHLDCRSSHRTGGLQCRLDGPGYRIHHRFVRPANRLGCHLGGWCRFEVRAGRSLACLVPDRRGGRLWLGGCRSGGWIGSGGWFGGSRVGSRAGCLLQRGGLVAARSVALLLCLDLSVGKEEGAEERDEHAN
jgi:hypothetical protein